MPTTPPDAPQESRIRMMLRALSHRNYRLFFLGQGVSLIGTWMSRVASGWLVFELAKDDAAWLLGLVSFCGLAPTFFLAPLAGVYVDHWNRHRALIVTQVLSLIQSVLMAAVAFGAEPGRGAVVWVGVLSLFQGIVNAFDMPARQSLLVEMVARKSDLPNAIALNSSLVNGGRLVGPAIAGVIIAAVGTGWCFVVDAVSYLAVVAALLAMRMPRRERAPHTNSIAQRLAEGVRYAFGFAPIRALLLLLALVSFSVMPQGVLLPVFAVDVLGGGPHTLGLLSAASGLGALIGAVYLASRRSILGLGRVIVIANLALGAAMIAFSFSQYTALSAILLVMSGCGMMTQMAASNTIIQTIVEEDKRGRVMSFYGMAFQGTAPFGSLLAGWLAGFLGAPTVVLGSGIIVLIAGIAFATQLPKLRRLTRPVYRQLGILPAVAEGVNAATELAPGPRV